MVVKHKDNNPSGLGRAIINKKVKDARQQHESGIYTTDVDPSSHLKSVTQERDLEEFFSTAQLAGTQFTAERRNLKIIQQSGPLSRNPYLLTDQEEQATVKRHQENKQRLRVPRRPPWSKEMTTAQLERQEKDAFLDWRRGLAELQERDNFLLTPFERNLEVWRQLWRVLERSHLIVQIVDARNPLRFRCEDLESYATDIEGVEGESGTGKGKRRNLLLVNKADLLTPSQRRSWGDYFDQQRLRFAFFSATSAAASQPAASRDHADSDDGDPSSSELGADDDTYFSAEEDETVDTQDQRTKILSVRELEELFENVAPNPTDFTDPASPSATKLVIGLVGYPNVGKSSTINAILGEKKVSVSATPGKTKHFQTIHLSEKIILCDCPGLVFPQFATTKADLVCDGVLPIDQLREHTGPIALVAKRIPKDVLEATYGLTIQVKGPEEGGDGTVTVEDFLVPYAIGRGFMRSGQGTPDEARAARYILKDYVNGKLLYVHPPPGVDEAAFNQPTHLLALLRAASKKRAPVTRVVKDSDTFIPSHTLLPSLDGQAFFATAQGIKSQTIDSEFFGSSPMGATVRNAKQNGQEFTRARLYPHQNAVADDGTPLSRGNVRLATTIANAGEQDAGKKHHRKPKRTKQRSGKGYD